MALIAEQEIALAITAEKIGLRIDAVKFSCSVYVAIQNEGSGAVWGERGGERKKETHKHTHTHI